MEFSKYELTDNVYDIIERNKANILWILNNGGGGGNPTTPIDTTPIPKYYDSADKFLASAKLGEIGRVEIASGQAQLLMKVNNGLVAKFNDDVEIKAMIDKVKELMQSEIINNQNDILGLIETLFTNKYLDVLYASAPHGIISGDGKILSYVHGFTTTPKDGDIGELHFENADGTISFNVPFKMGGTIQTTFYKDATDKDALSVFANAQDVIITSTKNGFFTDGEFHLTKAYGNSSSVDTSLFLTKAKGDVRYVLKEHKTTPLLQYQDQDATNKFLVIIHSKIDKDLPYGDELKVKIDPTLLVAPDGTKITIATNSQVIFANGDFSEFQRVWKDKSATDVLNFEEIAHNLNDYIVLTKRQNDDTNSGADYWEFDRFESTTSTNITLDDTTLKALENDAL